MPRFLNLIRIDESGTYEEPEASFQLEERMGALFEEMKKAGVMLDDAGLAPTSESSRVHWADGRIDYTDGPFTETKESWAATSSPSARTRPRRWSGPSGSSRPTRRAGP